jgi:membrane protease YdiL (CAAX protease family)
MPDITSGRSMSGTTLGETTGPLIAWLFTFACFAVPFLLLRGSSQPLPQALPFWVVFWLFYNIAVPWGVVIVFLVLFVTYREKQRSLRAILASLGLKREGAGTSVLWTFALIPSFVLVYVLLMVFSYFLGPIPFLRIAGPVSGSVPLWYPFYMIAYSFFPVAVIEEALVRGYMLDRLMPDHPSTLRNALPALLIGSALFTLYHLPAYLGVYLFSSLWTVALLVGNVFPWSMVLGAAYVRARVRNILGPVLIHFLADATPYILPIPLALLA